MDTQRLILLFIFGFSLLMLWEAWQRENRPKPPPTPPAVQQTVPTPEKPAAPGVPGGAQKPTPPAGVPAAAPTAKGEIVRVTTDLFVADIDTLGGTLKHLELTRHKDSADPNKDLALLGPDHL